MAAGHAVSWHRGYLFIPVSSRDPGMYFQAWFVIGIALPLTWLRHQNGLCESSSMHQVTDGQSMPAFWRKSSTNWLIVCVPVALEPRGTSTQRLVPLKYKSEYDRWQTLFKSPIPLRLAREAEGAAARHTLRHSAVAIPRAPFHSICVSTFQASFRHFESLSILAQTFPLGH